MSRDAEDAPETTDEPEENAEKADAGEKAESSKSKSKSSKSKSTESKSKSKSTESKKGGASSSSSSGKVKKKKPSSGGKRRMPKKKKGASGAEAASGGKKPGGEKKSGGASKKGASGAKATDADAGGRRYLCVHCGHRFVAAEEPERCPSCLRRGGLERLEDEEQAGRRAWLVPTVVVGLVVAVGAGYAFWNRSTPDPVSGEAPTAPLSTSELRGYLRAEDADGPHAQLFEAEDAVEALAEQASGGGAVAQAEALIAHVRHQAEEGAFEPWLLERPRETPPKDAEWAAAQIGDTDEAAHLYPLEVALATTAALREADVPAMVAEIWAFPGDRRPPDPSGQIGYFGVAVWEGEPGEGTPTVLDPYGGHATEPEEGSYRVLTDVQAVAARLGLEALHRLVHESDSVQALSRVSKALRLDRRSPYLRALKADVLILSGGMEQALEELQSAAQMRPDGPRRARVAAVFLAMGEVDSASREIAAALEQFPDFANAHATLGAVHLAQGELDLARQQLAESERLEPRGMILPMLWAEYYLRVGDQDMAVTKARQAVEARPHHWQTRLSAARVFRAAARYEDMRRQAHRVLELVPSSQREVMRQQILQLLGPTALEEVDEDPLLAGDEGWDEELTEEEIEAELAGEPGAGSELSLGSSLLGGEEEGGGGPSLLGGGGGDEGGPSLLDDDLGGGDEGGPGLMLGDPSNLRLREPGGGLQLQLGN